MLIHSEMCVVSRKMVKINTFYIFNILVLCNYNAIGNFFFLLKSSFTNLYSYIVCTYTSFHRDICMDVVKAYSSVSEYIVDFKSSFLSSSPPRIHVIWLTLGKFFTKPKPTKKILIFLDDVIFLGSFFRVV